MIKDAYRQVVDICLPAYRQVVDIGNQTQDLPTRNPATLGHHTGPPAPSLVYSLEVVGQAQVLVEQVTEV